MLCGYFSNLEGSTQTFVFDGKPRQEASDKSHMKHQNDRPCQNNVAASAVLHNNDYICDSLVY